MKKLSPHHYWLLLIITLLGAILRFAYLDFKPWGIDEVITTIFSLGLTYDIFPQQTPLPLKELSQLFTLNSNQSCSVIAENLIRQSTHPPLFFCGMHRWLHWLQHFDGSLLWQVRCLPAFYGVISIPVIYCLNRVAFSPQAGLMGAMVMAVSPFHLYLSQEARHYTLPILILLFSLILWLKLCRNIEQGKRNFGLWLLWGLINGLSLYIHYFAIIALGAEYITLFIILSRHQFRQFWTALGSCLLSGVLFLPWLSIILNHASNSKTSWLSAPEGLSPLFQTLLTWVLMVIAFPIEEQPLPLQMMMGFLMLLFTLGLIGLMTPAFKKLWQKEWAMFPLVLFLGVSLLEFALIVYGLGKDITVAPRYHFIYYPVVCSLLGACLSEVKNNPVTTAQSRWVSKPSILITALMVSLISCYCVVINLSLNKPYRPQFITTQFAQSPQPLMIVMGHGNVTEMALGLGYGLTLETMNPLPEQTHLAFFDTAEGYAPIWEKVSRLLTTEAQLWVIAPGLVDEGFPATIAQSENRQCDRNRDQFYRIGFPFQGYRCQKELESSLSTLN